MNRSGRRRSGRGPNEQYDALIKQASQASLAEPANVKYRYFLNVYRWRSISRVVNPGTGELVLSKQALDHTARIVDELQTARRLCPTYGPPCALLGQLELFILDRPSGADHVRLGVRLAPNDATAVFTAGLLEVERSHADEAARHFARCLRLDGSFFADIVEVCTEKLKRPDLAVSLAGENPDQLVRIAEILADRPEHRDLCEGTRRRALELLRQQCERPDAATWRMVLLADMYVKGHDDPSAIKYYLRAVEADYGQAGWHLALAQALARTGDVEAAIREARICLRLRPQTQAAKKLIEDISTAAAPLPSSESSRTRTTRTSQ